MHEPHDTHRTEARRPLLARFHHERERDRPARLPAAAHPVMPCDAVAGLSKVADLVLHRCIAASQATDHGSCCALSCSAGELCRLDAAVGGEAFRVTAEAQRGPRQGPRQGPREGQKQGRSQVQMGRTRSGVYDYWSRNVNKLMLDSSTMTRSRPAIRP